MLRFVLVAIVATGACFNPTFQEGRPCSASGECPGDQECNAMDNRCYSPGTGDTIDAAIGIDATQGDCDPASQQGCAAGEKCTFVVDVADPLDGSTRCATDGNVGLGGACTASDNGQPDDCMAGGFCLDGTCQEICSSDPDTCGNQTSCVGYFGLFADRQNIGLCTSSCDPLGQDCMDATDVCYISTTGGICAPEGNIPPESPCNNLNECQRGSSCLLPADPSSGQPVCNSHCDLVDLDPRCPLTTQTCASLANDFGVMEFDPRVGICVDCTLWSGQIPACM